MHVSASPVLSGGAEAFYAPLYDCWAQSVPALSVAEWRDRRPLFSAVVLPQGLDLSLVRELSVPEYLGCFLSFAARSSSVNILVCTWFSYIFEYILTRFLEVGFLGQK